MKTSVEPASGPGRIRQLNRRAVLAHIRNHGATSRSALIPALGLSAAAVSSVVNELIAEGLLREAEEQTSDRRLGRPVSLLELNPTAAYVLGLVLRPGRGQVYVEMAWADYNGKVTVLSRSPAYAAADATAIVAGVIKALRVLEQTAPERSRIAGVAIGMPGVVENDTVRIAPQLPIIEGEAFIAELRQRIAYPLAFHNDVNLGALSELQQQPRLRALSFAYLYIASGVGAGIALRGQIWTGSGWAGEIGQLRITRGREVRRSFEELLSTDGILADQLQALGLPRDDLDALAAAVDARDKRALRLVNRYSADLCDVIQVLNAVLDLDEVMVDFPSDVLFQRLRPRVEVVMQDSSLQVAVTTPAMGHGAAIRGAALSALNQALATIEQRAER